MLRWTPEEVEAVAPDEYAARAGRALAVSRRWSNAGYDDEGVWGECAGTGPRSYQTQAVLDAPAFRCSCPSRKAPCKHVVGLLFLWAEEGVDAAVPPGWVTEWRAARQDRAERAAARPRRRPGEPVADPEAQAKRAAQRAERVESGVAELARWLEDLVRHGLAAARRHPWTFWDQAAARMVDAQAPGLASRVRRMAGAASRGDEWADALLEQAALTYLACEAHSRVDVLPPPAQADLRAVLGQTTRREDVVSGTAVRDHWDVLGRVVIDDERLKTQRVWLRGVSSGTCALVLSFAAMGQVLDSSLAVGDRVDADVAFYPGSAPARAVVVSRHGEACRADGAGGYATIADALDACADALGANPWLERFPMALGAVTPLRHDGRWWVRDVRADVLAVEARDEVAWTLHAIAGGTPVAVFGEWREGMLRPMSVGTDVGVEPL